MVLNITSDTARKIGDREGFNIHRDLRNGNTILLSSGAYISFDPSRMLYCLCGYQQNYSDISKIMDSVPNDF